MALITRFSRLFTADMHAVMDRMEEPDILLKQALRDMEAALAANEQRVRQLEAQRLELDSARERAAANRNDLTGELDVCLEADNDDLARSVIRRKLQAERQLATFEDERERISRRLAEEKPLLTSRKAELAELKQKADVFDVAGGPSFESSLGGDVAEADVEVALLKEKQRKEKQRRAGS